MAEQSFQVGVKAVIKNRNNEILCIHDTVHDRWDIPGGRIDTDEDIETCLSRELQEEIGVTAAQLVLRRSTISPSYQPKPDHRLLLLAYTAEISGEPYANEPNTEIAWLAGKALATKIANKYPDDFCEWIAEE